MLENDKKLKKKRKKMEKPFLIYNDNSGPAFGRLRASRSVVVLENRKRDDILS